jgi:AraC family transcriptional regulator, ethanolamine operon transcriptional activator
VSFFQDLTHQISANTTNASHHTSSFAIFRAADIDEFTEMAKGYRLSFTQIEKGPFIAEAVQTRVGGLLLSAAHYGRSVIQAGEPPPGKMTFAMLMSEVPARWQGREFGPDDLLAGTHRVEMDMISKAGYTCLTASFSLDLVEETSNRCGYSRTADAYTSTIASLEPKKADMLRLALTKIFNEAIAQPVNDRAATWARNKQEDLLHSLLTCLNRGASKTKSVNNGERARVLKAALAAINDQPEDVVSVGELCRVARASERTLDYAFRERFGLAPAQYMKILRLNGVQNELCQEQNPSTRIADIANKWGFWHLGQFAKDYRNWFGELPSETFQRRQGWRSST